MSLLLIHSHPVAFSRARPYSSAAPLIHFHSPSLSRSLHHPLYSLSALSLSRSLALVSPQLLSSMSTVCPCLAHSISRSALSTPLTLVFSHSRSLALSTRDLPYPSTPSVFLSLSISPAVHHRNSAAVADMHNWSGGALLLKGTEVLVGGFAWSCVVAC